MIRHLREELEHANNQIASPSRPGTDKDEHAIPVPTQMPAASPIGKSSALEDCSEAASTTAPRGQAVAPRGEIPEPAAPVDTVLVVGDEEAGAHSQQVGIELKAMSLKLEALEKTLKKEKETVAKWQMRVAEQSAKSRRMEEEVEAVKKRAREEVEASEMLQSKAGKAVRELEDQLKLERQRTTAKPVDLAERERQLQIEAAQEAAGNHLMSASFVAPGRM